MKIGSGIDIEEEVEFALGSYRGQGEIDEYVG
jgi:hypothetical protein